MSVLIVGAGIAGILSGYHLKFLQPGINLQILEARSKEGGRIQNVEEYDFSLDLGGQDLFFADRSQLSFLLAADDEEGKDRFETSFFTQTRPINREDGTLSYRVCAEFMKGIKKECIINVPEGDFYRDDLLRNASFVNESLASFLETFFLPTVKEDVKLNTAITKIDWNDSNEIVVTDQFDNPYTADKLILAVPITQLKKIKFDPPLPSPYKGIINKAEKQEGARIFVEFSEKFYDDATRIGDIVYWDAAQNKQTDKNIITIQGNRCTDPNNGTCNKKGKPKSKMKILNKLLRDLDKAYGKRIATESFEKNGSVYYFQNWSKEPYIQMSNRVRPESSDIEVFREPLDGRIWFAGEYFAPQGFGAGESGQDVALGVSLTL